MNYKVFCAGTPYLADSPEKGLEFLEKENLGDEVAFTHAVYMKQDRAKKFGAIAASYKVPLTIHAPYYLNLANPEKVKNSERIILDACQRGEAMNAECVVIHAGYYMGNEKLAFERIHAALKEIVKKTSCPIGVEVMGKVKSFGTIDEVLGVTDIKGVVPVMDFAHWYARNQGVIDYQEVYEKFKGFKHLHSHFSGIEYGPSGEKNHMPLGTKGPSFHELAHLVTKKKWNLNIVCECPNPFDDALKMRKILEKV